MKKIMIGFGLGAVGGLLVGIGIVGPALDKPNYDITRGSANAAQIKSNSLADLLTTKPKTNSELKALQKKLADAMLDPANNELVAQITEKMVGLREMSFSAEKSEVVSEKSSVARTNASEPKENEALVLKKFETSSENSWEVMRDVESYIKKANAPKSVIDWYNQMLQDAINEIITLTEAREMAHQIAEAAYEFAK